MYNCGFETIIIIGPDSSLDSRYLPRQQSNNFTVEWLGGVSFKEQYTF